MTFPWEVSPAEKLCVDEGCPQSGAPHVCVTYDYDIPTVLRRDRDNRAPFMDAELVRELAAKIEDSMAAALFAPLEPQPQTAVRVVNGRFETVQIREDGSVIEPEPQCPFCSPVLLCSKHFTCT